MDFVTTDYIDYINECIESIKDQDKNDYGFKLRRWSEDTPYWCIFFYERGKNGINQILSFHALDKSEVCDFTLLLDALVDSGVYTRVTKYYFTGNECSAY